MDKLAAVERVSRSIVRVLGLNPGPFTLQGTNTYIVGRGDRRILIDTGDGEQPEYLALLKKSLGSSRIDRIILTHWHADHIGGVSHLLDATDIVTPDCAVYKHRNDATDAQAKVKSLLELATKRGRLFDIADTQVFDVDGLQLRALFTPGHTDDHMAFTIAGEQPAEGESDGGNGPMLVTGDLILGQGTTIVGDLQHGTSKGSDGKEKLNSLRVIEGYIQHRNMRERQILGVLAQPPPANAKGWKIEDITSQVYPDITDPKIILAAQHNTLLHLRKLLSEGRVRHTSESDLWVLARQKI
ncbi:Beta-lactamase-like protein 2 [Dipsacomyces acuminosporus]|nr:Beta-lactamase-like protein 2 [Dipsacomyces acuminosporus]